MYTAESVAIGHPDKICDQIADALLDEYLTHDPQARCAIEVAGGHGKVFVTGEVSSSHALSDEEITTLVKDVVRFCGDETELEVIPHIAQQSPEIASGVDTGGAGDQGVMVGYACNENEEMMPQEMHLARALVHAMGNRDGKAQVTLDDNKKVRSFITSVCGEYTDEIQEVIDTKIVPLLADGVSLEDAWMKNPNGKWKVGGFHADAGLTGRKIVVDAYGPRVPVGGGAFSGKDATKVDRSAAYMARKIATDYIKGGAREATVYLAYAIGQPEPTTAIAIVDGMKQEIEGYDLRPQSIIKQLDLLQPKYLNTARSGHFGQGNAWD